jgi:hypothetical protein
MKKESKYDEIWFYPVYIDVKRRNEYEEKDREDEYLSENHPPCFVFLREKETIEYKSHRNGNENRKESYKREDIWEDIGVLKRSEYHIGEEESKKSPHETCRDTSETRQTNRNKVYLSRSKYVFIGLNLDLLAHV